jgi:thiamine pyrophosphate-dependent acetolactate synthase large subunit-like protein
VNGTQLIARILQQEGVDLVTCFPSNPLIEEVAKLGIRPVAFRHERGAVMAADGISRTSGRRRFGVCAIQSQAGAENAMGGLAQAYADNVPVLVLPGGVSLNQISVKPNFVAGRPYQYLTRHVEAIYRADDITRVMRRAFHALRNGPGGPVVVELTADVCGQEVPERARQYVPPGVIRAQPAAGAVSDAVRALRAAKNPVIWAGQGVLMAGASAALSAFAELTGLPVFCTMPGKSAMDERHPLCLGAGSGLTTKAAGKWLSECDLILALGSSLTRTSYGQPIRANNRVLIQNTDNVDDLNKDETVHIGLLGDTLLTIEALIDEVRTQVGSAGIGDATRTQAAIAAAKAEWLAEWSALLDSDEEPLNTYRVIAEIERNLDLERSIVTHDAGAPRDSIVPFFTATTPHSYVGWGKTTHLGFGIPLMIGAKMAHPDRFCLNLMGDGAFGMSGTDIETAARSGFPITTVVLNNGGMATYPGGFPTARERYGVSHMHGDYAMIAEGMGATGITVRKVAEMAPALRRARELNADGRTCLIDVHSNMEAKKSRY